MYGSLAFVPRATNGWLGQNHLDSKPPAHQVDRFASCHVFDCFALWPSLSFPLRSLSRPSYVKQVPIQIMAQVINYLFPSATTPIFHKKLPLPGMYDMGENITNSIAYSTGHLVEVICTPHPLPIFRLHFYEHREGVSPSRAFNCVGLDSRRQCSPQVPRPLFSVTLSCLHRTAESLSPLFQAESTEIGEGWYYCGTFRVVDQCLTKNEPLIVLRQSPHGQGAESGLGLGLGMVHNVH